MQVMRQLNLIDQRRWEKAVATMWPALRLIKPQFCS